MKIKIGTRASQLALWQAHYIQDRLTLAGAETEIVAMETRGDKVLDVALSKIGSKGVFTEELEEKLLNKDIHIAVHSAKDLQSDLGPEFEIIAFTDREEPNDVLISDQPIDMSGPVVIGTSSVRRVAFFKRYYPHIRLVNMRGNLQTRLRKMREGQCDALALAYAGVNRMNYNDLIVHRFPLNEFIPPVGQGTIAVEISVALDEETKNFVKEACNNTITEECLTAERAFLKEMNGGCSIPVFGYAKKTEGGILFTGGITSLDGQSTVLIEQSGTAPAELGRQTALRVLENGGREILEQIKNKQ